MESLEKSELTIFTPKNGDLGYLKKLEKDIDRVVGTGRFVVKFDKKSRKAIAFRDRMKLKKKRKSKRRFKIIIGVI